MKTTMHHSRIQIENGVAMPTFSVNFVKNATPVLLYLQDRNNFGICIYGVEQIFVWQKLCFPILILEDVSKYMNLLLLSLQLA
jgi:hypothetical protein